MPTLSPNVLRFAGVSITGDLGPVTAYTSRTQGIVFFPKAWLRDPETTPQRIHRRRFALAMINWRKQQAAVRNNWKAAAERSRSWANAPALWLHYSFFPHDDSFTTLAKFAPQQLQKPPPV